MIHKLMDSLKLMVGDAGRQWFINILAPYLRFCKTDGKSKVFASRITSIHELL